MTSPAAQQQPQGLPAALMVGGAVAAAGSYPLSLAVAARFAQLAVRARLFQSVIRLWPLLDPARLSETFAPWVEATRAVINAAHSESSASAGEFYTAMRMTAIHAAPSPHVIAPAPLPDPETVARALGWAAPGTFHRHAAPGRPSPRNLAEVDRFMSAIGAVDPKTSKTALTLVLGTSARLALDGGRTTVADAVHADENAVGWFFKTDASPCYFCAMIASRGVVFKRESFALSDAKFIGDGTAKVHNHCGCSLAPAFSHSQELPVTNYMAAKVYANRDRSVGRGTKNPALTAFRKAWDDHLAPVAPAFPVAQPVAA